MFEEMLSNQDLRAITQEGRALLHKYHRLLITLVDPKK